MKLFYCVAFFVLITVTAGYSQSDDGKKKKKSSKQTESSYSPSSREFDGQPSSTYKSKKASKKKSNTPKGDRLVEEYHQRMEANAKRYKKMAKDMEKPQYSDPSYFGHKKKPKKRPVGKRKFCQECGIVH
jgi:hypothetical protein